VSAAAAFPRYYDRRLAETNERRMDF
jgi:hypothetical protein